MDDRVLSSILAVGIATLFAASWMIYLSVHKRRNQDRHRLEAEAKQRELDQMIEAGLRTPEGANACIVCRCTATSYMPVSGSSWMDRLPLLNRLFSLPPRYVIVDNIEGDLCLCKIHKAVAVRRLEEFHAGLRAERAKFNAMHEQRVAAMDGGELVREVMEQHQFQLRVLRRETVATPLPQLKSSVRAVRDLRDEEVAVVSVSGASLPPAEFEPDEQS